MSIYDLDDAGRATIAFGRATAVLQLTRQGRLETKWLKHTGRLQKTVPLEVRRSFASELQELHAAAGAIRTRASSERHRLEALLWYESAQRFEDWRDEYLRDPITRNVATRLIWRHSGRRTSATFLWVGPGALDADGNEVPLHTNSEISLWHPAEGSLSEVTRWRKAITQRGLMQPFKQAYRETFRPARQEKARSYTRYFKGHILDQRFLYGLAQSHGWEYEEPSLRAQSRLATRLVPEHAIETQLRVTSLRGSVVEAKYVTTREVRFRSHERACRLTSMPLRVFSEGMRDVALFVAAATVAKDPLVAPDGDSALVTDYRRKRRFGRLSKTGVVRRDVLEPRLALLRYGERLSLDDRSLVVVGNRATYRIHLDNASVLREPDGGFISIPEDAGPRVVPHPKEFVLPFEDATLEVILAEAFVLAHDDEIKDPLIVLELEPQA